MILNRATSGCSPAAICFPGKGEGFIFLVAGISLVAVALGVAALIIVMSVMNGFRAELFDKIVGLNGHAVVQGYDGRLGDWQQIADAAKKTPGVTSALPLIEQPLMASANGRVEGVLVRGMRVEDIRANKTITGNVVAGDLEVDHARAAAASRSGRGSPRHSAPIPGSEISLDQPGRPLDRGRHRAARSSPTPSARSSRSASTITTRRSSSCRCRTRRTC